MSSYLLDTDTVSYALRGTGNVGATLLALKPSQVAISALTLGELRFGAEKRKSKKLHRLINVFCESVEVFAFDARAAAQFGSLCALALTRALGRLGKQESHLMSSSEHLTAAGKEALRKTVRGLREMLLTELLDAVQREYRLDVSADKARLP